MVFFWYTKCWFGHQEIYQMSAFSLPTQRCFQLNTIWKWRFVLFSAYAEVFPSMDIVWITRLTFLCLRRGVSRALFLRLMEQRFSLPTQRCFLFVLCVVWCDALFSAYAEVFPKTQAFKPPELAFLCLRRGVSAQEAVWGAACNFSLPTQRCFWGGPPARFRRGLFSAYAEVFLDRPHRVRR